MPRRIIVLAGNMRAVERHRQERGLRHRDVVGISPRNAKHAGRGLCGSFEIVRDPSWNPTPEVYELVERNLMLISLTTGVVCLGCHREATR